MSLTKSEIIEQWGLKKIYVSAIKTGTVPTPRGNLLTYIIDQQSLTQPVIALELTEKWYGVYVILPGDNSVAEIPPDVVIDTFKACKTVDGQWVDHCYHPELLYRLAECIGGYVCPLTIELAYARWCSERNILEPIYASAEGIADNDEEG